MTGRARPSGMPSGRWWTPCRARSSTCGAGSRPGPEVWPYPALMAKQRDGGPAVPLHSRRLRARRGAPLSGLTDQHKSRAREACQSSRTGFPGPGGWHEISGPGRTAAVHGVPVQPRLSWGSQPSGGSRRHLGRALTGRQPVTNLVVPGCFSRCSAPAPGLADKGCGLVSNLFCSRVGGLAPTVRGTPTGHQPVTNLFCGPTGRFARGSVVAAALPHRAGHGPRFLLPS
jgi:hypothetical protein